MPAFPRPAARAALSALALVLAAVPLAGCAGQTAPATATKNLAAEKIPARVDPGTTITVGTPETQVALRLSGLDDELPFKIKWANLSGGPQCSEAFRAHALDVCSAAEIPSIQAHWTGLDTKLVGAAYREDPLDHPIYELGVAPGAEVNTLKDLRGKRIAYSPGQAQGALVLRVLAKAGLSRDDVELVEMPSTGDVYPTALGGKQVDVAPLGGVLIKRYVTKYGRDGGKTLRHGLRDDPAHLWVPAESVADPQKAAAIREFVRLWARAQIWVDRHPEEWIAGYYVKDQGLSEADGKYLVRQSGHPDIPRDWTSAIARQQKTVDLLAKETGREDFDVETLFDRRYEHVAADALKKDTADTGTS
ncbi:ABC transporter substrate-binding protein [Streptomyces sp. NPDC049954]|uniref:ABC transporter substrate-binding protein n=1 Tax=Streptomyces sp. NPDC049954 TaxID=3155779 RepID=UPI003449DEDB